MKNITLILCFFSSMLLLGQSRNDRLALIPYPTEVIQDEGYFMVDQNVSLYVPESIRFEGEARYLQAIIKEITGKDSKIVEKLNKNKSAKYIEFRYDPALKAEEEYVLDINPQHIIISANNSHGAFNANQTLRQLLMLNRGNIPASHIKDNPSFKWRGMHLDVSRHFFTLDYLKKYVDRLAFYKLNKFHFHLTDDQGWRIEIKKYPKLTEIGGWRTFNNQDTACIKKSKENPNFIIDPRFIKEKGGETLYGGFYTQKEIKELIQYAQDRHIEIIPEIDMPGHMMAAIKAYPFLVDGEAGWGELFSTPICPCKDEVYEFSRDVLSEVLELFPSKYIHIGADEVDKESWQKSALCKEYMLKHNIEAGNMDKLQSYFVHQMQDFVESKGKKIIAWDEILEGGTNKDVTIMYWRGWVKNAPFRAVEGNSEVIMTPTNPLYFDYENNNTSVNSVYNMDVVYSDIPNDKKPLILGAQANLWTEMIPTEEQAEFQAYPRMLALSERVWTNNTERFDDFSNRLLSHYSILDNLGVNYRLPDIEGFAQENVYVGSTHFMVESPLPEMTVRYTLDSSFPSIDSPFLSNPLLISKPTLLKMALFSPTGVRGEIYNLNFKPVEMQKPRALDHLSAGLNCKFYNKYFKKTEEITGTPDDTFIVSEIKAPKESSSFGLDFTGYIDVPETGIYSFFFTCDDGGVLYIDNELIIDNDGQHSPVLKSGQAALEKGPHPFQLLFLEAGGGYTLKLQYTFNGSKPQDIPSSWLKH